MILKPRLDYAKRVFVFIERKAFSRLEKLFIPFIIGTYFNFITAWTFLAIKIRTSCICLLQNQNKNLPNRVTVLL